MQLSLLQIAVLVFHVAGMVLIAASFSHIATLVYEFYAAGKLSPSYIPKTKILAYPLLIALGGFSFLFLSFSVINITLAGFENVAVEYRFLGTSATLIGNLIALYGMYGFYKQAETISPEAG